MTADYATLPFDEAIRFFRGKENKKSLAWTDFWQEQHDKSFVVAGAMRDELVADFRAAIDQAISEGTGLAAFRARFDEIVQKHGWSYNGSRGWRSRVIYQTNMQTAYQAGRYAQLTDPDQLRLTPYWQYHHSDFVAEPRLEHKRWSGLVLSADDPWWETHYPPNGWGCRCYVTAITERQMRRLGKAGPDTAPPLNEREVTAGKTGPNPRTVTVPEGIDPGWAYTPGRSWVDGMTRSAGSRMAQMPYSLGAAAAASTAQEKLLVLWFSASAEENFPLAVIKETDAEKIGAKTRVVQFSPSTRMKQLRDHGEIRPAEYARAQEVIDRGRPIQDSARSIIYLLELDDPELGGYVLVVKASETGNGLFLQSYRRLSRNEAKLDKEVRRLLQKEMK